MAAHHRSSLELMLHNLQRSESLPDDTDTPPPLPARPVSRARLPRSRHPHQILSLTLTHGSSQKRIEITENSRYRICLIQKWCRGYRVRRTYCDLTRRAIFLQSFIRGEIARNNTRRRLSAIGRSQQQKTNQDVTTTVEETTKVSYKVLVDLQRRVLATEAKAREKHSENIGIKARIGEIEKKWEVYEERMKWMDKTWQDQFLHIQKCLAAAVKHGPLQISFKEYDPDRNGKTLDAPIKSNRLDRGDGCNFVEKLEELSKLKERFKAWKKEYSNKLREVQYVFKRIEISQEIKSGKKWCGR